MRSDAHSVEVCLSPAIFPRHENPEAVVAVVDIFRASSAIATAFASGVDRIIPVATIDEARSYQDQGYLVAGERDGIILDFADFDNSPFTFIGRDLEGQTIVYSTTNGTQAIKMASRSHAVVIASFINHSAVVDWLIEKQRDIVVLCAGWKNRFSLEDMVYAGALVQSLIDKETYHTNCDGAVAAMDLWNLASQNLPQYKEKFAHRHRLKQLGLDDCVEFCLTFDSTDVVPVFQNGYIRNFTK